MGATGTSAVPWHRRRRRSKRRSWRRRWWCRASWRGSRRAAPSAPSEWPPQTVATPPATRGTWTDAPGTTAAPAGLSAPSHPPSSRCLCAKCTLLSTSLHVMYVYVCNILKSPLWCSSLQIDFSQCSHQSVPLRFGDSAVGMATAAALSAALAGSSFCVSAAAALGPTLTREQFSTLSESITLYGTL